MSQTKITLVLSNIENDYLSQSWSRFENPVGLQVRRGGGAPNVMNPQEYIGYSLYYSCFKNTHWTHLIREIEFSNFKLAINIM